MKIKVKELQDTFVSLDKLFKQDIDAVIAFQYSDAVKAIKEKYFNFISIRDKLGKKFGFEITVGNMRGYTIPENNLDLYNKELDPLLDEEIEVNWKPIPLSKLKVVKLSMEDCDNLRNFIDKTK